MHRPGLALLLSLGTMPAMAQPADPVFLSGTLDGSRVLKSESRGVYVKPDFTSLVVAHIPPGPINDDTMNDAIASGRWSYCMPTLWGERVIAVSMITNRPEGIPVPGAEQAFEKAGAVVRAMLDNKPVDKQGLAYLQAAVDACVKASQGLTP